MDKLYVYLARALGDMCEPLVPAARDAAVKAIKNETARRESYHAWRLLESALEHSLGISAAEASFRRSDSGKWVSDKCFVSLSHSFGIIAVAVSHSPVGVDVQAMKSLCSSSFAERILTEREYNEYSALDMEDKDGYLMACWSSKEALFKTEDSEAFVPSRYDSADARVARVITELCGEEITVAVAADRVITSASDVQSVTVGGYECVRICI